METTPAPRALGRENSIGFLRLLFAAFVIYGHAYFLAGAGPDPLGAWTGGTIFFGKLGVQAFFVLSGYLVATSYQHSSSLLRYFWHRFLRLAPALWACLAVTVFVIGPILFFSSPQSAGYFSQDPSPLGYFGRNFFNPRGQIFIGDLLLHNPHPRDINGSLWTLFYEASCYVMVAGIGLLGLLTRFRRIGLALLVAVIGAYVLWTLRPELFVGRLGRLFDTDGKALCVYFASGMIWTVLPQDATKGLGSWVTAFVAGLTLLAGYHWGFHVSVAPVVLAPVLFWLAEHLPFRNWEERLGGDYSYGLYVYGYPVQQLLSHFGWHRHGVLIYGVTGFLIAMGLAILSWRLVEKPALAWKSLLRPTQA